MGEDDVEARILQYFIDFTNVMESNGLISMLGGTERDCQKKRCKLLIKNLQPEVLKVEITRLVSLEHREAKADDVRLYNLILQCARTQQKYHLMQNESKRKEARPGPVEVKPPVKKDPPRTGCWVCKGNHWLRDCPVATEEQRQQAIEKMKQAKDKHKLKRTKTAKTLGKRMALLNGMLEAPYCLDTGAEANFIPRRYASELESLKGCKLKLLEEPVYAYPVGDQAITCKTGVVLNMQITTAAGKVNLQNVHCIVLEADEHEFLLDNKTMKDLVYGGQRYRSLCPRA
ncbi:hypothetical protein THRCLA_23119 [Thraustotheca clavata]|uniref:Uncharacterized protein n=1 Tax=Thraustotheca clavata TaxID=74557 RepID=A0A1V9YDT1_9STRA|nr:hypothetical protein THRCLA_23119 [Thraustotheca clavata]